MKSNPTYLRIIIPHYKFDLTITEKNDRFHTFTFVEDFIHSQIQITRTWYFDLYPKIQEISKKNRNNITRKRKNKITIL